MLGPSPQPLSQSHPTNSVLQRWDAVATKGGPLRRSPGGSAIRALCASR